MLSAQSVDSPKSGPFAYRGSRLPIGKILAALMALLFCGLVGASMVSAGDLTSESFIQRGGSFSADSNAAMTTTAPSPEFTGAAGTLGDSKGSPPDGSAVDLATASPEFWAIVVGAFPTLDLAGDLTQFFLDDDDDGDGLDDDVETATGVFVSPVTALRARVRGPSPCRLRRRSGRRGMRPGDQGRLCEVRRRFFR